MKFRQYFVENNQQRIAQKKNLENEVEFLLKRIQLIESDIHSGKAKTYHHDMLNEMTVEFKNKSAELLQLTSNWMDFNVSEEYISATKYDIQAFLGLLDQEVPNVQLLNTIARDLSPD